MNELSLVIVIGGVGMGIVWGLTSLGIALRGIRDELVRVHMAITRVWTAIEKQQTEFQRNILGH